MYNRYVPQPDGSYRRNRIQTTSDENHTMHQINASHLTRDEASVTPVPQIGEASATSFLRKLIPQNLDTGDLLVIVLLLLMAGDSKDGSSSALLTLALYLFL